MATDDFDSKRPDHSDFKVTSELKKSEFSGIRVNSLSGDTEIWVVGEIRKVVDKRLLAEHANAAMAIAMEEVFGLNEVGIEGES